MDTPSRDDVERILDELGLAVDHVGELHRSTLDAYANEHDARLKLFSRLARLIAPALPAIAERKVERDGDTYYYLEVDERKRQIWYLARSEDQAVFLAASPDRKGAPGAVSPADGVRVIRLGELVRRTAVRLRGSLRGLQGRREEAQRLARVMDAVALLLDA